MATFDTEKIAASLKKIPWWGYAGGGGVALALAYYVRKQLQSGQPSQASQASQAASVASGASAPNEGLQLADLAGIPYDTFDPSFNSYPDYSGNNPSGYNPGTTPPSGAPGVGHNPDWGFYRHPTDPSPQSIDSPPPAPPPAPAPQAHIRARDLTGPFSYWDTTHAQGVPVRPTAGSSQIAGYLPFGSAVTVTGQGVAAQYNNQGSPVEWLPVQGGFIQAVDLASGGTGHGGFDGLHDWPAWDRHGGHVLERMVAQYGNEG